MNYKVLINEKEKVVLKTDKENIITLIFSEDDNKAAENIILDSLVLSYEKRVITNR